MRIPGCNKWIKGRSMGLAAGLARNYLRSAPNPITQQIVIG